MRIESKHNTTRRKKMVNVRGKWALITGASRGLGYEMALYMAGQGCNLILHSRTLENSKKVAVEAKALGVEVVIVAAEMSVDSSVKAMLETIEGIGMTVDFVFNNAAVQIAYRVDYFQTPVEDFDMSFKINLIAVATICYHFLPKMIARGFGRIVNTTSGIQNEPQQAGYSASKAALNKFTIDLSTVIDGTNVMMSLTDPGWCQTDLGGKYAPNTPQSTLPGLVVPAFMDDKKSGRIFSAQDFTGLSLEEAIKKAEIGVNHEIN